MEDEYEDIKLLNMPMYRRCNFCTIQPYESLTVEVLGIRPKLYMTENEMILDLCVRFLQGEQEEKKNE